MKNYTKIVLGGAALLGALAPLGAQTAPALSTTALNSILAAPTLTAPTLAVGTAAVGRVPTAPVAPLSVVSSVSLGVQKAAPLNLTANETDRVFSVSVTNPSKTALNVLGVQSSAGIYVVSFPSTIAAGGSGSLTLLYYAQTGISSTSDLVRVLTDQGPIAVEVDHGRQAAVTLSATTLHWSIGETPAAKSVQLSVVSPAAVPKAATALGSGNSAQIAAAGSGVYTVTVTPGSTAKAGSFPVIIQFQAALPDQVPVITCTVD